MSETETISPTQAKSALDLGRFRLPKGVKGGIATVKQTLTVPVKRPGRQMWIRVRPGDEWMFDAAMIEDQETRSNYVVTGSIVDSLGDDVQHKTLRVYITRAGTVFLWPIKAPDEEGRQDTWNESARAAAEKAETHWVRITPNMADNKYDVHVASGDLPEPVWPADHDFQSLFALAFSKNFIEDAEHPLIKKLTARV